VYYLGRVVLRTPSHFSKLLLHGVSTCEEDRVIFIKIKIKMLPVSILVKNITTRGRATIMTIGFFRNDKISKPFLSYGSD